MEKILQSYLRRLTNLSGNNRSLLLLRLISDQFIDINDFDFALNTPSFHVINDLIGERNSIPLCEEVDTHDADSNRLSQRLKKIMRIEQFIFQERGAKDLYIGWPFVRGKFSDNTPVRCPLIFFPVSLELKDGTWYLQKRKDVNVTLNKTFLLAYAFYNKVNLDEELIERVIDDFDTDSTVFRTQLYELLKDSSVEVNFNQENFIDKLSTFKAYKKEALEQEEKTGQLKLHPEAVLGIFPQAGSYLVPDYVHLLENEQAKDLEEFFLQRTKSNPEDEGNTRYSDRVLEENTFTPFELDAHQEKALNLIKKGNSMVIQGPPGTGKSQLISNLICDYMARGKNVLLVCQKKAALDVVFQRLRDKELHDFIGLVHDFKNDRKDIFEQLARQVDRVDEYRQKNNSLDAIQLERSFLQASRKIDQANEELTEYKEALFDESECGKSVKELYLISSPDRKSIPFKRAYRNLNYTQAQEFENRLSTYFKYYERFEDKNHFWSGGKSFSRFSVGDLPRIKDAIQAATKFFQVFENKTKDILGKRVDYESAIYYLSKIDTLGQLITNLDNDRVYQYFIHMIGEPPELDTDLLSELERRMMQFFKGSGPEVTLPADQLGRFQEALEHAIKARKGVFSWIRWRLFSEDKIFITRVLVNNDLKSNSEGFRVLLERVDNRLNFEHNLTQIQQARWLTDFPKDIRKIDIQNWFFYKKLALKTYILFRELRSIENYVSFHQKTRKEQIKLLTLFKELLEKIPEAQPSWNRYLSQWQISAVLNKKVELDKVETSLNKDFDSICEYHQLRDGFSSEEKYLIEELLEEDSTADDRMAVFQNSLALSWIDHIEEKYPVLRGISSNRVESLIKDIQQAVIDKAKASNDILLLKSREKTYHELAYNRLNNLVTYRELYHQVTKKKRIWPIRRVINQFSEELFKLLPCWMASPESASAIFPMEEFFDLVIFDEASQCFAERGIPAMYRGKQVVIAGDDKQLKPFDLYRVRWEDENEEELPDLEVDSLLNLASRYLPQQKLQGHYRSQSLELIEFSNFNFYEGRLQLLPHIDAINTDQPAIQYIKVDDGVWEQNTNLAEANRVLDLISQLQKKSPSKSLGVVTFNARQQELILDLLDEQATNNRKLVSSSLFVKNIENVQGDERDVIIFSTAYAPDKKGKLQLRFGSLNQLGGENRLNVAVTRARESIYIVTSLHPSQLKTDDSKNPGPKLLKDYLEYGWRVHHKEWIPSLRPEKKRDQTWYLRKKLAVYANETYPDKESLTDLPFADLSVKQGDTYLGMIMTDDELFFDALSIKDSFVYQPALLSEKKWPTMKIDSRETWINWQHIEDRMKIFYNRITK
ncbi:MAG: DUF4011 domain-containing protein [Cyclobacteriaceae bacterium]|nr:DUF4011 domain-containing protein [Cyclobacteriaceae bacterium HetDA_MAG_MS6]